MTTIQITDAITGATTERKVNKTLNLGDRFQLIGNSTVFIALRLGSVLSGTIAVVTGVSECGEFKTTARVVDTLSLT